MVKSFANLGRAATSVVSTLGTLTKTVNTSGNVWNTMLNSSQRDLNIVGTQANPASVFFQSASQVLNDPFRKVIDNFTSTGLTGGAVLGSPQVAENITQLVGSTNKSKKDTVEIGNALSKIPNGTKAISTALSLLDTGTKLLPESFLASTPIGRLQTATKTLGLLTSTAASIASTASENNAISNIANDLSKIFNPVSVVKRDSAEVFGLVGGIFEPLKEVIAKSNEASEFFNFFDNLFKGGKNNKGSVPGIDPQTGRQPNVLRNHNTYNYIITLGILTTAEYNSNSYRQSGSFSKIILRSGGGELGIRQTTSIEDTLSIDAEYFIEDLEVDCVELPDD